MIKRLSQWRLRREGAGRIGLLAPWLAALPAALLAAAALSLGPAPAAWAQARAAASAAPAASAPPKPATELRIIEDDRVRIEETRLRGQLQRITVSPKGPPGSTMRGYEINVGAPGRDPSQDKSAAGQRVWSVLRF